MPNQNLVSNMQTVFLHNGQKVEETIFLAGFMPFFAKIHILCIFSLPKVQLIPNSDSTAKFLIQKFVRAKVFNEFLPRIVKNLLEIVLWSKYLGR